MSHMASLVIDLSLKQNKVVGLICNSSRPDGPSNGQESSPAPARVIMRHYLRHRQAGGGNSWTQVRIPEFKGSTARLWKSNWVLLIQEIIRISVPLLFSLCHWFFFFLQNVENPRADKYRVWLPERNKKIPIGAGEGNGQDNISNSHIWFEMPSKLAERNWRSIYGEIYSI